MTNIDCWLKKLYQGEIKATEAAISNERIWAAGAGDTVAEELHNSNISELEEYIVRLEELIDNL